MYRTSTRSISSRTASPHAEYLEPLNDLVTQGKVRYVGDVQLLRLAHHADVNRAAERGWSRPAYRSYSADRTRYQNARCTGRWQLVRFGGVLHGAQHRLPAVLHQLAGRMADGQVRCTGVDVPARALGGWWASCRATSVLRAVLGQLDAFANEHGHSVLDLAFSWLLAVPVSQLRA